MNNAGFLRLRHSLLPLFLFALALPLPALRAAGEARIGMAAGTAAPADIPADDEFGDFDEYALPLVYDPFEKWNRSIFKFNGFVMDYVLRPVANAYTAVVPFRVRLALGNFFNNLAFPLRFVSNLLQGRFERTAAETGKFLVNSTVGIGGLFKASDNIPELVVPEEDLGQTFGVWGFGPGPYLMIPVLGPSNVRDGLGRFAAYPLRPTQWSFAEGLDWTLREGLFILDTVNTLPDNVDLLDRTSRSAIDPYVALRNGYSQYRNAAVKQ